MIELSDGTDNILVKYAQNSILDLSSAKYGPEHIWFDDTNNQWSTDIVNQAAGHNVMKDITINTGNGATIFKDDHGLYSQNIIPLSHNSFIIINDTTDNSLRNNIIDQIASTFKFTKQ